VRPDLADPEGVIRHGWVLVDGRIVANPASLVPRGASVVVRPPRRPRGTRKLAWALASFGISVHGRVALDVGAAAGGFTIVLLEAGARRVYAVDVGHGQLLGSLRANPRVVNLERVNLAELDRSLVPDRIDVISLDLSYLSVASAADQLAVLPLAPEADLVALVKPMFELGLAEPPTARSLLDHAVTSAGRGLDRAGWRVVGRVVSPIRGSRGAVEFFVHARWGGRPADSGNR
jgi:23S rRNA (cytidine1920-2'-O)/16S rRNA (cytidine1409-2'-O)-methyltransferase